MPYGFTGIAEILTPYSLVESTTEVDKLKIKLLKSLKSAKFRVDV